MIFLVWILILVLALLLAVVVVEFFIIRGFLRGEKSSGKHEALTGREVELLRRKLASVGLRAITHDDVYNLIKTIRDTHLGKYVDKDPYIPADPYEDIGGD